MFRKLSIVWTVALLASAAAVFAEEQEQKKGRVLKASKTMGFPVINRKGEELGGINDLVVSPTGARLTDVIISSSLARRCSPSHGSRLSSLAPLMKRKCSTSLSR